MEIRITYRSEIYIKGISIKDIRETFESLNLDPLDADSSLVTDSSFIETVSVEDSNTYRDLLTEWNHCYDSPRTD